MPVTFAITPFADWLSSHRRRQLRLMRHLVPIHKVARPESPPRAAASPAPARSADGPPSAKKFTRSRVSNPCAGIGPALHPAASATAPAGSAKARSPAAAPAASSIASNAFNSRRQSSHSARCCSSPSAKLIRQLAVPQQNDIGPALLHTSLLYLFQPQKYCRTTIARVYTACPFALFANQQPTPGN